MLLDDNSIAAELRKSPPMVSYPEDTLEKYAGIPVWEEYIQPASLDVHLGDWVRYANPATVTVLDPLKPNTEWIEVCLPQFESFLIRPGMLLLGATREWFNIPADLAASVDGISSLGRNGLIVHSGSTWIDPGFTGNVTLEISASSNIPVKIRAGMRIGQVVFHMLKHPARRPYGDPSRKSKYQGQSGPTASRAVVSVPGTIADGDGPYLVNSLVTCPTHGQDYMVFEPKGGRRQWRCDYMLNDGTVCNHAIKEAKAFG